MYPFSDDIKDQLVRRQSSLGIKTEDLEKVTLPILAQAQTRYQERLHAAEAERQRQLALESKTQRQQEQQHHQEYESKLRRYEEKFSETVQGIYPLSRSARNRLRAFQHSLELNAEDVERIEHPILAEAKTKYRKKLQAAAAERQRQLELETEAQRQLALEQAEYRNKLRDYEQAFSRAIEGKYRLNKDASTQLSGLEKSLGLKRKDLQQIEKPILANAQATYRAKLKAEEEARQRERMKAKNAVALIEPPSWTRQRERMQAKKPAKEFLVTKSRLALIK